MTLTREDRLKIQLTRAMAKRDLLNANYVLEKEALDEDIAKLQNELDNLEAYGDMALVAEQTEPTISKMEQVDKDINVRSKTEQNCSEKPNICETCRNKGFEGCEQPCLGCGCCGLYEPKTEPMKTADYCDICKRDMCEVCIADATNPYCVPSHYEIRYEPKDEPQTDCAWK